MLYLTTGANGACKSLFTIYDVRQLQIESGRPVYFHGFKALQPLRDFGWIERDPREWESFPDNSIVLWDEAHNFLPVRKAGSEPPQYVRMLAEHRVRGFDFFICDQHPMNIDAFVRRLVGVPGWHRHLKRLSAGNAVSVLTWSSVNPQCEKSGSGETGEAVIRAMPKEVFTWYESASLHTAKPRIPRAVYVLGAVAVAVPVLGWIGVQGIRHIGARAQEQSRAAPAAASGSVAGGGAPGAPVAAKRPRDMASLLREFTPRVEGMPETAPRYDELTKPVRVPVVVGCWSQGDAGWCITQQGTRVAMSAPNRQAFIEQGRFIDYDPGTDYRAQALGGPLPASQSGGPKAANSGAPAGIGG